VLGTQGGWIRKDVVSLLAKYRSNPTHFSSTYLNYVMPFTFPSLSIIYLQFLSFLFWVSCFLWILPSHFSLFPFPFLASNPLLFLAPSLAYKDFLWFCQFGANLHPFWYLYFFLYLLREACFCFFLWWAFQQQKKKKWTFSLWVFRSFAGKKLQFAHFFFS